MRKVMRNLNQWFDSRTGIYDVIQHALYENIPSGARWRYITGSMLVFAFSVQAITGIFLWMAYSPSSQTAYESVYYIQHEMTGGWLVRGVHHFMAQAMVVVMGLHLLQVVIDGAYRAPRELNYWLGIVLMQLVMGLGLTGYLLPWDQKGYWATNVATNLMTLVPFVGKELQQIAVGGNEYGHHTLTRFFAMHTGVLPAALIGFLVLHIAAFRKHGIMAKITPGRPDQYFWPHQVLLDAVGCLVLLGVVLLCVVHFDITGLASGNLPEAHQGAELGAPADPSEAYSAARPEWYYLFLFQLLKYFHGTQEIIGALIIPGIVMTILALAPILGRWNWGHAFNVGFLLFLVAAVGVLTTAAMLEDGNNYEFQEARKDAEKNAERTHELINRRQWIVEGKKGHLSEPMLIPKEGAVWLVRNDPLLRGPRLFKQHCASCHSYANPKSPEDSTYLMQAPKSESTKDAVTHQDILTIVKDAKGKPVYDKLVPGNGAPNLFGFASREWLRGFLDPVKIAAAPQLGKPAPAKNPTIASMADHPENHNRPLVGADYFGNTNHREGRMVKWVTEHVRLKPKPGEKKKEGELDAADVDAIVAALSAQARLRTQQEADAKDTTLIKKGITLIEQNCAKGCHKFGDTGELGLAPDLTGYGSYEWMMGMISDPSHHRFYRQENDRMPSFAADLAKPASHSVSIRELSLIVDWLRGEYYLPEDEHPVLPHKEEVARATVTAARPDVDAKPKIVGAPEPKSESNTAKAQRLFARNCAACHSESSGGEGIRSRHPSAPNLHGFASREWLAGLLDPAKIGSDQYFGKTSHHAGEMATFVDTDLKEPDAAKKEKIAQIIAALSAEAGLPAQADADKKATDDGTIAKGKTAMGEMFATAACTDCHKLGEGSGGSGPDLTGYGSRDWLVKFIGDPGHEGLYGKGNDRMPSFAASGPGPKAALLKPDEIDLIARWLRGEKLDP
jgi:quinol-cytochrome oxidoreductase complex cytochrome b subunit/mono/diheme cytochrome c family protein